MKYLIFLLIFNTGTLALGSEALDEIYKEEVVISNQSFQFEFDANEAGSMNFRQSFEGPYNLVVGMSSFLKPLLKNVKETAALFGGKGWSDNDSNGSISLFKYSNQAEAIPNIDNPNLKKYDFNRGRSAAVTNLTKENARMQLTVNYKLIKRVQRQTVNLGFPTEGIIRTFCSITIEPELELINLNALNSGLLHDMNFKSSFDALIRVASVLEENDPGCEKTKELF